MYISYKNAGMKNNFYILPKHLVGGLHLSLLFCMYIWKTILLRHPPPPLRCYVPGSKSNFQCKKREDRMVKDESIQRVEIKKIETLFIHFSYRGKTINCSNGGKKIGTVLHISLEWTLEKRLHREDRSKLM